jgi:asparagine synthase (glutamine-hydrolysing)
VGGCPLPPSPSQDLTRLGHRRLASIDLATGRQPIPNENRSVWVILNGEIYNYVELREDLVRRGHRFQTATDTEVRVHLYEDWGESFVHALRGMFAIPLWDDRSGSLLLVRDRVGKKPLYYSVLGGRGLAFASQLDALVADPDVEREIDPEAVDARSDSSRSRHLGASIGRRWPRSKVRRPYRSSIRPTGRNGLPGTASPPAP